MAKQIEQITIESAAELREWLTQNHTSGESVWLVTWKKNSGQPYVSYDEIVDQCLCFGWIDSLPKKLDDKRFMLRISPRNPKSNWSGVNKQRIARLLESNLMQPAGLATVEHAKQSGTWTFLDDVERLEVPEDLQAEFENYPGSGEFFERFPPSSKRGILEWIKSAKTAATCNKRIVETCLLYTSPSPRDS